MDAAPATLAALADALETRPADLPVRLSTPEGALGDGYHVTELKLADIRSIDCAGRVTRWTEAQLQLLDGGAGLPMRAGKLAAILRRSVNALPGLADASLRYEAAPGNRGLSRFHLAAMTETADGLRLDLTEDRVRCKPAEDFARHGPADRPAAQSCCG